MDRNSKKAWLYLLPSIILLGAFLVYPLIDVAIYSLEECYNFASQTYQGVGLYNYSYVLHDPYFLQAVENTFVLVIITVPISTILALVISTALASVKPLRKLYQTVYFLPYVTNTLAVGLVFMVLFQRTEYTDGLVNLMLSWFGAGPIDFINGPHWAKMFVLCFYTIWVVLPFKILVLTSALASVNDEYYKAARVDGTSRTRIFFRITLPYMLYVTTPYLIATFTANVNNFNVIYLLSGGDPVTDLASTAGSTDLLVTWLYKLTIDKQYYNVGAVVGILTFIILAVGALLTYRNSKSYREEGGI